MHELNLLRFLSGILLALNDVLIVDLDVGVKIFKISDLDASERFLTRSFTFDLAIFPSPWLPEEFERPLEFDVLREPLLYVMPFDLTQIKSPISLMLITDIYDLDFKVPLEVWPLDLLQSLADCKMLTISSAILFADSILAL